MHGINKMLSQGGFMDEISTDAGDENRKLVDQLLTLALENDALFDDHAGSIIGNRLSPIQTEEKIDEKKFG